MRRQFTALFLCASFVLCATDTQGQDAKDKAVPPIQPPLKVTTITKMGETMVFPISAPTQLDKTLRLAGPSWIAAKSVLGTFTSDPPVAVWRYQGVKFAKDGQAMREEIFSRGQIVAEAIILPPGADIPEDTILEAGSYLILEKGSVIPAPLTMVGGTYLRPNQVASPAALTTATIRQDLQLESVTKKLLELPSFQKDTVNQTVKGVNELLKDPKGKLQQTLTQVGNDAREAENAKNEALKAKNEAEKLVKELKDKLADLQKKAKDGNKIENDKIVQSVNNALAQAKATNEAANKVLTDVQAKAKEIRSDAIAGARLAAKSEVAVLLQQPLKDLKKLGQDLKKVSEDLNELKKAPAPTATVNPPLEICEPFSYTYIYRHGGYCYSHRGGVRYRLIGR